MFYSYNVRTNINLTFCKSFYLIYFQLKKKKMCSYIFLIPKQTFTHFILYYIIYIYSTYIIRLMKIYCSKVINCLTKHWCYLILFSIYSQMANGEQTCAISNRVVLSVVRVLSSKLIFTGHNKIACPDAILNRTRQIIAFDVYQYRWHDHSCLQQLIVA